VIEFQSFVSTRSRPSTPQGVTGEHSSYVRYLMMLRERGRQKDGYTRCEGTRARAMTRRDRSNDKQRCASLGLRDWARKKLSSLRRRTRERTHTRTQRKDNFAELTGDVKSQPRMPASFSRGGKEQERRRYICMPRSTVPHTRSARY